MGIPTLPVLTRPPPARRSSTHASGVYSGEAPLEAITSGHIDAFRAALVEEGRLSPRTINKYLALIHGILKRAQRVYGLSANAAGGVERQPARRSGDFDVLSAAEVEALVRAASSSQDTALFATASDAGLRLGELRALRWHDLDFEKRLIYVRRSYVERAEDAPKSGSGSGPERADDRPGCATKRWAPATTRDARSLRAGFKRFGAGVVGAGRWGRGGDSGVDFVGVIENVAKA